MLKGNVDAAAGTVSDTNKILVIQSAAKNLLSAGEKPPITADSSLRSE